MVYVGPWCWGAREERLVGNRELVGFCPLAAAVAALHLPGVCNLFNHRLPFGFQRFLKGQDMTRPLHP